jgi:regulator of nucleoside diphosphate kinase
MPWKLQSLVKKNCSRAVRSAEKHWVACKRVDSRLVEIEGESDMSQILITAENFERLERLIATYATKRDRDALTSLEEELGRAEVVNSTCIPPDVVTMNSRVRFISEQTGEEQEVVLVYPADADFSRHRVSVLAPLGSALLGLRVGQAIDWPVPSGQVKRFRVLAVTHQPEAVGSASFHHLPTAGSEV